MKTTILFASLVAFVCLGFGCKEKRSQTTALQGSPGAPPPGPPPPPPPPKPIDKNSFGRRACRIGKACYKKNGAFGQIAGKIEIQVDAQGKAVTATYTGKAPGPVKECIVAEGKKVSIPLQGSPGTLRCSYSGTLMEGGMEMLSESWGFSEEVKK